MSIPVYGKDESGQDIRLTVSVGVAALNGESREPADMQGRATAAPRAPLPPRRPGSPSRRAGPGSPSRRAAAAPVTTLQPPRCHIVAVLTVTM